MRGNGGRKRIGPLYQIYLGIVRVEVRWGHCDDNNLWLRIEGADKMRKVAQGQHGVRRVIKNRRLFKERRPELVYVRVAKRKDFWNARARLQKLIWCLKVAVRGANEDRARSTRER